MLITFFRGNYKKFSMELPEFPYFEDLDHDLNIQETMWKTFEEFYTGNYITTNGN